MTVLVSTDEPKHPEGTEAVLQRCGRMALILSFSLLGLAAAYFGALYLIAS